MAKCHAGCCTMEKEKETMIEIIDGLVRKYGISFPAAYVFLEAKKRGINEEKTDKIINDLMLFSEIFEPKKNFIQRI